MSIWERAFTNRCCTFTATTIPSLVTALCTWAKDAAPIGSESNDENISEGYSKKNYYYSSPVVKNHKSAKQQEIYIEDYILSQIFFDH